MFSLGEGIVSQSAIPDVGFILFFYCSGRDDRAVKNLWSSLESGGKEAGEE